MSRKVVVLGSTGSIGVSTLDLFEQAGVAGRHRVRPDGRPQCRASWPSRPCGGSPRLAVIEDESLPAGTARAPGRFGRCDRRRRRRGPEAAAMGADWVMSAIVGAAGLAPTLAAARTGAVIALANKESLVCAGPALLARSPARPAAR